ncbi:MAG: hypothetical protein ACTHKU_03955 [Verrucomicrobiota bacterium]
MKRVALQNDRNSKALKPASLKSSAVAVRQPKIKAGFKKNRRPSFEEAISIIRTVNRDATISIDKRVEWVRALDIEMGARVFGVGFLDERLCLVELSAHMPPEVEEISLAEAGRALIAVEMVAGTLNDCEIETSYGGWKKFCELLTRL